MEQLTFQLYLESTDTIQAVLEHTQIEFKAQRDMYLENFWFRARVGKEVGTSNSLLVIEYFLMEENLNVLDKELNRIEGELFQVEEIFKKGGYNG
jgi:hypothetical protein